MEEIYCGKRVGRVKGQGGSGHTRHRLGELSEGVLGDALEMKVKDSMDKKLEYKLKF